MYVKFNLPKTKHLAAIFPGNLYRLKAYEFIIELFSGYLFEHTSKLQLGSSLISKFTTFLNFAFDTSD